MTTVQFKILAAPGDHRDDFESLEKQLNKWSVSTDPQIVSVQAKVTAMTDTKNVGRYLMTVLVAYRPAGS